MKLKRIFFALIIILLVSAAGYAQGSLRAVRFLADKRAGLFDMFDVLNLR